MYVIESWAPDGPNGESGIATKRRDKIAQVFEVAAEMSKDARVCIVTVRRSDVAASSLQHTLFIREGYFSATTPIGTRIPELINGRMTYVDNNFKYRKNESKA